MAFRVYSSHFFADGRFFNEDRVPFFWDLTFDFALDLLRFKLTSDFFDFFLGFGFAATVILLSRPRLASSSVFTRFFTTRFAPALVSYISQS